MCKMPTEKDCDSEHSSEQSAGPSNASPDASTLSKQPIDKPSCSKTISPSQFYGLNSTRNEEEKPENPKKTFVQRIEKIADSDDDLLIFDDSSSADSNVALGSSNEEYGDFDELSIEHEEEDWNDDDEEDLGLMEMDDEDEEFGLMGTDEEDENLGLMGTTDDDSSEMHADLDENDGLSMDLFRFPDPSADDESVELSWEDDDDGTSDEDSDLPDDPYEREVLGSLSEPDVSLHLAAMKGDTKSLARWHTPRTAVWARKAKGDSPLHCAARSGDVATVENLLKMGALLDDTNKKRHTPLEVAALCGHATVVKTLLDHGAGSFTEQMEHALLATKSAAVVYTLTAASNNSLLIGVTGVEVLSRAARDGRVLLLKALLKSGADANWPGSFSRTALHTAASKGHVRCVLALLESNADVTCVDDRLWTPLHYAAFHNHRECVRVLLAAGADPNAHSGEGELPYDVACDEEIHRQLEYA